MAYNPCKNKLPYSASLSYHFNKVEAEGIKANLRSTILE